MKLPIKAIICYLVSIIAIFTFVNLYGSDAIEEEVNKHLKSEASAQAELIADEFADYFFNSDIKFDTMKTQLEITADMLNARIWFVNLKNVVVVDTAGRAGTDLNLYDEEFLDKSEIEYMLIKGIVNEPTRVSIEPVISDYTVKGYICVLIPVSRAAEETVRYMDTVNIGLLIISLVLLLAFAMIYLLVAYPTRKIRTAALEYAKGNYDYPMNVRSHDEIRDLADSITYMVGEIRNVEDYQKKFIANVSHDFRSPLTSIRGYAEAMKDGTIPPEAQSRYLDIILFETDRLSKLTSNILDLNRIDAQGAMLDITSFDINKVIKNTAAAFEGICRQKKIVIELEFASEETFVDADMSRIQQVLYNLTDNAIKFSKQDSKVVIETEEKGTKALIRVRDYGVGIPKESIKKIWDRFYKSDSSRGKDKKGTGLGLSIVKEVISAHEENINVISTEGVGTEFTFTLTLSESM